MFFNKFIQSPIQIGSITPSSTSLARKMLKHISWEEIDTIVELGAGTGVFTKSINENINSSTKAIIFEKDTQMRQALERAYPAFYYGADAEKLDILLHHLQISKVDCIVSGLPFANFSPELRGKIMNVVIECLKPGGLFIAFQYSLQMKNMLRQSFKDVEIGFELVNMPPAFVYTCRK